MESVVLGTLTNAVDNGYIRGFDLTIFGNNGSTTRHSHKPAPPKGAPLSVITDGVTPWKRNVRHDAFDVDEDHRE